MQLLMIPFFQSIKLLDIQHASLPTLEPYQHVVHELLHAKLGHVKGFNAENEQQYQDAVYHKKKYSEIRYRNVAKLFSPPQNSKLDHTVIQRRIKKQSQNLLSNGGYYTHFSYLEEEAIMKTLDRYQYIGTATS